MHKAAYWLLQFKTFAFAPICSHEDTANLNNEQNPTSQGSWWQNSHWLQQALGVAQHKCNWLNLTNSITNTVIKFVFFHLQICHPNAAPGAAVGPWFSRKSKPSDTTPATETGLSAASAHADKQLSSMEGWEILSWIRTTYQNILSYH